MVRILSTPLMIVVGLVMVAAALGLFSISTAEGGPAQQPPYPPVCPCAAELSVGGGTALPNECVSVAIRTTKNGKPNGGVKCEMSVIPAGTGAYVDPEEVTTDENGEATVLLCAGSATGSIVVKAKTDCCGSEGQLEVPAGTPSPTPPPATPTVPPPTGVGTGGGNSSSMPLIAIWSAIALGALGAGSVLAWQIGGWRRRSS